MANTTSTTTKMPNTASSMLEELQNEFRQIGDRNSKTYPGDILENVIVCSVNNENVSSCGSHSNNNSDNKRIHSFVVKFPVTQKLSNEIDILHGGAIATAVDIFTSILLYFASNKKLSVSINLQVSYISAAPKNSIVYCEARVDKLGRSLQFASCTFWTGRESNNNNDGNHNKSRCCENEKILVATGQHTMYVVPDNNGKPQQLHPQNKQKQTQEKEQQEYQHQLLSKL